MHHNAPSSLNFSFMIHFGTLLYKRPSTIVWSNAKKELLRVLKLNALFENINTSLLKWLNVNYTEMLFVNLRKETKKIKMVGWRRYELLVEFDLNFTLSHLKSLMQCICICGVKFNESWYFILLLSCKLYLFFVRFIECVGRLSMHGLILGWKVVLLNVVLEGVISFYLPDLYTLNYLCPCILNFISCALALNSLILINFVQSIVFPSIIIYCWRSSIYCVLFYDDVLLMWHTKLYHRWREF